MAKAYLSLGSNQDAETHLEHALGELRARFGVGVLDAQRNSGSVLVFMNRTVTDKSKQPVYDGSRLRVDYEKVDGQWKIQYITPI